MKTNTWRIGEYAKGGIITLETDDKTVDIICKQMLYNSGSKQDGPELQRKTIDLKPEYGPNPFIAVSDELNDLTSSYWAEQIMDWLQENSRFKKNMF